MPLRFMYTNSKGGLSIVLAAPKEHLERLFGPLTQEQYKELVVRRSKPDSAVDWTEMPEDWSPPEDRTFRNAWKKNGRGIEVDMAKAKELHKEKLRQLRAPILSALDIEYQRADEEGDLQAKKEIAARKQSLRDVTDDPRIASAQTPDELKAVIPMALLEQQKGK